MALNRLEWTQKEQKIDYHVLKWPTSYLHPRTRNSVSVGFELKEQAGSAEVCTIRDTQQEGIGLGVTERPGNSRWRSGGRGTDGMATEGLRDAAQDRDGLTLSTQQAGRQRAGADMVSAAAQNAAVQMIIAPTMPSNMAQGAVHTFSVTRTVQRAGNRMREIIGRLRDTYLKQQKKAETHRKHGRTAQQQKERQGTRQVNREEVLSMQAENHYLLDSYDKNGQYSTLGRSKS